MNAPRKRKKKRGKKKKLSRPYVRRKQRHRGHTGPDIPVRLEDGSLNPEYSRYLVYNLGFLIRCTLEMTDRVEMTPIPDREAALCKITPQEAHQIFLRAMKAYSMEEVSPGRWVRTL